jgi:hypothetical protein
MAGTHRRNRVVAEITLAHIRQLAATFGYPAGETHVLSFLNEGGHAYGMWMCMMQAGENFIKSNFPRGLSKSDSTQIRELTARADICFFPTYPTTADGMSDPSKTLRI